MYIYIYKYGSLWICINTWVLFALGLRKVATQQSRKMCTAQAPKGYRNVFDKKDKIVEKRAAYYQNNTAGRYVCLCTSIYIW
jgi:hypothetical protein